MYPSKIDKFILHITRRRKRTFVVATVLASILFISYQFKMYYVMSHQTEKYKIQPKNIVKGTHPAETRFYTPKEGMFTCIKSGESINFNKVNDDYCDCADSSDEPGTSACPDGIFYCSNVSMSLNKKYPKRIPSSKINDGICDCCDGSDEYGVKNLLNIPLVSCPNVC
ncbi:uncharacterized protein [Euwallacea fornicatus]|uniref:uncharacterized protein n=1 Tax=Euwallacea fornicatus TaxID=995702 RepID=UPI00338FA935